MARFRKTTSKNNTYLQLVESYRNANKQPATRVLANLGNISTLTEEQIERLTISFIKAVGMEDKFQMNNFTAGKGYHYGSCLPVIALWNQLNLEKIINNALPKKVTIPVSQISLIQTANRFSQPGSKLACYRWYENSLFSQLKNFINFPDDQREKLHTYYRSLDYLCQAKSSIEQELYYNFNSYNQENNLIFYDLTSVYFEGDQAEMAVKGYSRDHRPLADQIVVGLVLSEAGIPIAHHVFEGNTLDKETVDKVVSDLETRFAIKNVIFVGDRGLLTSSNIASVKSHGYNYIMGMQRRNRRIINYLIEKIPLSEKEIKSNELVIKEVGYSDLSESFQQEYDDSVRFILCYNKAIADKNKQRRERNLLRVSKLLDETSQQGTLAQIKESFHKLKSFLSKYKMTRFYKIEIEKESSTDAENEIYQLKVEPDEAAISLEKSLDGKFFIQTEVNSEKLTKQQVVDSYKSLQKVERAFNFAKNEIDIRPVYVRRQTRIKGHVMICFLSLLMEILIEKKLYELFPDMLDTENKKRADRKSPRDDNDDLTMTTLMEELDTVRLVPLYINGNERASYISTSISNNVKKLLSALGIVNSSDPKYLRFRAPKSNGNKDQLKLNL
ncbi:MAG: IS1634 family transposase [Fidelibacterota bacterium]